MQIDSTTSLQRCITRLIESEMQFVSNMQSFHRRIVEPLINETWFSMRDFELLFGSVSSLVEFHNDFLGQLGNIFDGSDWIDYIVVVFSNILGGFIELYSKYCSDFFLRSKTLEKLRRHDTFCAFLKMAGFEMTPPTLHVHSYLQGPFQRIDTYLHFFQVS